MRFTKTLLAAAVLAAVPMMANAESDFQTGAGALNANARLDFRVVVPKFLRFQVGSAAGVVDLVEFSVPAANVGDGTDIARTNGGAVPVCIQNVPQPACVVGGCSSEVCADHAVFSTCIFRPEYACYHAASCARQDDGNCGWTPTPALTQCIADAQP